MPLLRLQVTLLLAAGQLVAAAPQPPPFTYSLDQGVPCPRGCGQDTLLADAQGGAALRRGDDAGVDGALDAVPELLKGKLAQLGCPSSGVIVTHNGATLDTAFAGSAKLNRSAVPLNIDSGFMIASISKTFATASLFLARDRGFLPQGLDTPLSALMPAFRIRPPARSRARGSAAGWRHVTLRSLAMQASGLPRETPAVPPGAKSMRETEARVLAAVANLTQLSDPFEAAHYSNLGLALVGRAVERAAARAQPAAYANATWESFVKRELLDPLGMRDTGNPGDYPGADAGARARLVDGVGEDKTKPVPVSETNAWDGPCGAMHSSFRDMAVWMNFLMDRPRDAAQRAAFDAVLSPSSRAEMRNSGFLMGDGISAVGSGTFEAAYMRGRWAANKLGCVDGYRSAMTLVPSLGLGVFAVATSTCDLRGDGDAVGFPVASQLIPQVSRALSDRDATTTASPPPPAILERVLGSYCKSDPAAATTIAVEHIPLPSGAQRTAPAVVLRPPAAAFDYSFVMEYVGDASATHGPNATEWRRVMGPELWLPKSFPGCTPDTASDKGSDGGSSTGLCSISCMRKMARGSGEPVFFSVEAEGEYKGKVRMEDAGAGSVCHRYAH